MKKIKYLIIGIIVIIVIIITIIIAMDLYNRKENPEAYQYYSENAISDETRKKINNKKD